MPYYRVFKGCMECGRFTGCSQLLLTSEKREFSGGSYGVYKGFTEFCGINVPLLWCGHPVVWYCSEGYRGLGRGSGEVLWRVHGSWK